MNEQYVDVNGWRTRYASAGDSGPAILGLHGLGGKELWRTHTIPKPDEPGGDTWGNIPYEERRHVGLWMVPSFDPEL